MSILISVIDLCYTMINRSNSEVYYIDHYEVIFGLQAVGKAVFHRNHDAIIVSSDW